MPPSLLIASPGMNDPFFEKSVVLVWHHDEEGAMGIVVNRTLEEATERGVMPRSASTRIADVLVMDEPADLGSYAEHPVNWGGPVDTDSGTLITTEPILEDEGWSLGGGLSVTRSHDVLMRLVADRAPLLLCLGYAGWGPGQLEREIAEGGWWFTEPHPDLIFDAPSDDVWERAIRTLGVEPSWVMMQTIEA